MGGVDVYNVVGKMLVFFEQLNFKNIEKIIVVLGFVCLYCFEIIFFVNKLKYDVDVFVNVLNMVELMLEYDFVIGVMGGMMWE